TLTGGLPAVLLPFWLRRHPIIVAILDPFMVAGYGAPKRAFAPLFLLWFGIGMESKIALTASVVFFIVYFATLSGVRALDPRLVQMAQIAGASEHQIARHIIMPGAVPNIFAGFRIAVPYAIAAAVIAELISSNRGLGYLVQTGAMNFDTTSVFAAIVAATLLVHAANALMKALEGLLSGGRRTANSTLPTSIAQPHTASGGEIVFAAPPVSTRDQRALKPGGDRRIGY